MERSVQINQAFAGKTVDSVTVDGFNQWTFHFTDGTKQTIDTVHAGHGIYGPELCEG